MLARVQESSRWQVNIALNICVELVVHSEFTTHILYQTTLISKDNNSYTFAHGLHKVFVVQWMAIICVLRMATMYVLTSEFRW